MESMERVNATDLVVNYIKNAIQSGQLKVGDKLPRETDIAKELGVGRSSLREGMKILNAYGVIESRQGEGTFVADNCARNFFEFLGFYPSEENMHNFLELRRVIEVGNIITIYDKLKPENIWDLEKLVSLLDGDNTIDQYVDADLKFHNYLINFSKNPMMEQINNMLTSMRKDLLYQLFTHKEIVEDARKAHKQILDALKNRDLDACIISVKGHLDRTVHRLSEIY